MEKKKLSTAEIMAKLRAEKAGGQQAESAAPAEAPAPAASAPAPSPAPAAKKPAAGGPKSTKDILAAARAEAAAKAGGAESAADEKPAAEKSAPAKPAAKPAAPGGGPKGTKDILAAARAQAGGKSADAPAPSAGAATGGGTAAKPSPKAAAKAGAGASVAASESGGEQLSVQDMLKAVRTGGAAEPAAEAKGPIVPKIPVKPAVVAKPQTGAKGAAGSKKGDAGNRRNFLLAILAAPFALAWTLLSATGLIMVLGTARFMFPNAVAEPPSKFKVGPPGDYPGGTVSNKWKAMFGIWIVNAEYQGKSLIYALSTVCTHLGCTPNWLDGEQKFKCPCHGSGFYITGVNFEGPAPRPLERFAIRVAEDGTLEIDKSQKFQQEMGQWEDAKSFVEIA